MQDRQLTVLTMARGETRRLLVEPRTTVLVVSGNIIVRGPLEWLAEAMVAAEQQLDAEQMLELASGGWIDLVVGNAAQLVLLPRDQPRLWRDVARCIYYLLGKTVTPKPAKPGIDPQFSVARRHRD